ncbi:IS200/IS605 family transposase [Luteolibacter luteus]|uniref:IS200/IS605 family transposase n=1 Tax=Luteolibacter luteus TaxID=2728835 RepID=A0A858RSW4_9BACT|nr:IS200/IS605 family transposase [Luteolibacter luteus]QJE99083.1 IS200/IS605 family transposase [Luteolibacter luteus]
MPSTYISLYYHLIFSTKLREATILPEWRERLHEYMGGILRGLEGKPMGIGGTADHVHVLASLKATHCLADVARELKRSSSIWVAENTTQTGFKWQEGYAGFSVSASKVKTVQQYIAGQEEHHRVKTFREELVEFLEKAGVTYDERYLD